MTEKTDDSTSVMQPHRSKRIGELNGPWALLLKLTLVIFPLFIATVISWGTWVTSRVYSLEERQSVTLQIVAQIKASSESISQHEREIAALQAQFNTRTMARDREMDENRLAHSELMAKIDRQSEKIDRLAERLMTRE